MVRLKTRWRRGPGDRGADVVLQCRGRAHALATALRLLRPQGTVIDLAFYTEDLAGVALGAELHHNGLTIRCAQIGRVPRGTAHLWDRERLSAAKRLKAGPSREPPSRQRRPRMTKPRQPNAGRLPCSGPFQP